MTLFLTSSPCDDNVPEGLNLTCVYSQENGFADRLRKACPDNGARFLIVAADPFGKQSDEMLPVFCGCFEACGIRLLSAKLLDGRNESLAARLVRESDILMLAGGHVPTQNAFFARLGLRSLLRGYTGTIIGISAGTMNAARRVYAQPEEPGESIDPKYCRFLDGLGLTELQLLPHYQKTRHYWLDGKRLYDDITYADSMLHSFIAIPDGSYVLCEDGRETLYGEAWRIRDGVLTKICEQGQCLVLRP